MKKLLVLVLVAGLASVSFGTITTPVSDFSAVLVGTTLTLSSASGLAGGVAEDVGFYDLDAVSTWSGGAILGSPATAGSLSSIAVYSSVGDGYGFNIGAGSTGLESPAWNAQAGSWFSVTVTGLNVGDQLDVEDVMNGYASLGTITVTPEPITLALLGLGGLFIRRK